MSPPVPLISVVIPVYNGARFLSRCVGSVLAQTESRYEILVVDDGSSDHPDEPVRSIADPRLQLLRHEFNRGPSATRNTGIKASRGQYVAFLDSDDWWEPAKLAEQIRLLESEPSVDCVFSDFIHISPDKKEGPWRGGLREHLIAKGLHPRPASSTGFIFDKPLACEFIRHTSFMHPSTTVVRRSAFDRVGLFEESLQSVEDLQMWIRLASQCRIGMIDKVLVRVEQRPESLGHQLVKAAEASLTVYNSVHLLVPQLPTDLREYVRQFIARKHAELGWMYRQQGRKAVSRQHYWESMCGEFKLRTLLGWVRSYLPG